MEKLPLFNVNFYKFECQDDLTDDVLSIVQKNNWRNNMSNMTSSNDLFFHKELFDWFDDCIIQVKNTIGLPKNISLPITSCWANKNEKLNGHHIHLHPNSILSGIFYLSSHLSGETMFSIPNYWMKDLTHLYFKNPLLPGYNNKIIPVKSTLIIFPSHVSHSVLGLRENETRYTISFNTYLDGEIADGAQKSRLHLKPKSVRDWHNET